MRNLIDSREFCSSLSDKLTWNHQVTVSLRSHVVVNPNFLITYTLRHKAKTLQEKIALAIGSWYLAPEVACLLRLDLEEELRFLCLEDQTLLRQFLHSKAETLIFLLETSLWHSRDFFGNMIPLIEEQLRKLFWRRIRFEPVCEAKRKRGYNDHGSKTPSHKWLPKFDESFTREQNDLEQERITHLHTIEFLRGFLGSS